MQPEEWANSLSNQFGTAVNTPVPYISAFVLGVILAALFFRERIKTKDATIEHRDGVIQEYKDKLSVSTPDEARAKLAELEKHIKLIGPRFLTPAQRDEITAALRPFRGTFVHISADDEHPETWNLQTALLRAVSAAGWGYAQDRLSFVHGDEEAWPGMTLLISDVERPTPAEEALMRELTRVGLEYKTKKHAQPGIRILITPRF